MSEAFLDKEKELRNKISLDSSGGGIKVITIDDYLNDIDKRFKKIVKEVTSEHETKMLFLDFLKLKENVDEMYMPSNDIDEYTLEKINNVNEILTNIYLIVLEKSPTIYTSQIQYFAYDSLFNDNDHMIFYKHLLPKLKDNFEVARYTIGVFKEIIFVHYDLEINNVVRDNITELIELLVGLCTAIDLDVKEELEGLID